jgi:hypothetical protein
MRPIAKRRVLRVLARTPRHGPGFGDFRFLRTEARAFVRAVAEWLGFGIPTRTPPERARLGFLDKGRFLEDGWFTHSFFEFTAAVEKSFFEGSVLTGFVTWWMPE